ncbi:hypothetical protein PTKIN_Ptkin13bG0206600 [Pterospermum kingtungense]
MGFLDLFVVAVIPVLKVLLVTGVGLFLAMDRINLLGPEARSYLNEIVFYLFCPALIFSNLAETITFQSLVALWFMPVNIFLTFIIGSLLAWILIKITKTPEHVRGIVVGCCSAGNLGNLVLIIVPAVCNESNNPFGESCSTYAEAYASLSMAVVGFITGTISPIRKLLIGDSAPLHVLDTSIYLIGEATIPCMTLIMGANLLKGLKGSEVSLWVITWIIAVRNIFLPLLGIGVVKAAHRFGLVGSDSSYQFVLMLQYALPPAMSVGTMTQLFQRGQGETSMIMLWSYAVAAISLTLWSTLFMWLLA